MNADNETSVDGLLEDVNNFLIPLRMGDGYSADSFQQMCTSIRQFHQEYANAEALPKTAVSIFVDLFPAIEGCMSLYSDTERQQILDAAVTVVDVISEGL